MGGNLLKTNKPPIPSSSWSFWGWQWSNPSHTKTCLKLYSKSAGLEAEKRGERDACLNPDPEFSWCRHGWIMERNRFSLLTMVQELQHSWVWHRIKLIFFFIHYTIKLCNTLLKCDMKAESTNGSGKQLTNFETRLTALKHINQDMWLGQTICNLPTAKD